MSLARTLVLLTDPHKGTTDVSFVSLAMTGVATKRQQTRLYLLKCIKMEMFHEMNRKEFVWIVI